MAPISYFTTLCTLRVVLVRPRHYARDFLTYG